MSLCPNKSPCELVSAVGAAGPVSGAALGRGAPGGGCGVRGGPLMQPWGTLGWQRLVSGLLHESGKWGPGPNVGEGTGSGVGSLAAPCPALQGMQG